MVQSRACQELENRVIRRNLCTVCGACVGMCPYFVSNNGRVLLKDVCDLSRGRCSVFCPRLELDFDKISQAVFGTSYSWDELGTTKEILMARSNDSSVRVKAQYGGVVTGLVSFALSEGIIDSAVLTLSRNKCLPHGVVVSTGPEVKDCAGSSYVATPTLEAFNREAQDERRKRIGVVGTPCQVQALANMKISTLEERNNIEKVRLVIGLFCTWALPHDKFTRFLEERVAVSDVVKLDIPPPPANIFEIYTKKERISVPLDELRSCIREACTYCTDMTAEFADISVGAAEGIDGWNTVIIRSDVGKELVESAEARGIIEMEALPNGSLIHLKEASLLKKKRALRNIIQKSGCAEDLLYLKVSSEIVRHFLREEGKVN